VTKKPIRSSTRYLTLVVRQIIFNQFEEKTPPRISDTSSITCPLLPKGGRPPSPRTWTIPSIRKSCTTDHQLPGALRAIEQKHKLLDIVTADTLGDMTGRSNHLVDYSPRAVVAADAMYNRKPPRTDLFRPQPHGLRPMPLGAELEFSNIGHE
jgi:hypothetical protein